MSATRINTSVSAATSPNSAPVKIGILALARDCEATLPSFISWLKDLEQEGFSSVTWVGENGSSDRTRQLLEAASSSSFIVLDTSFMSDVPSRLARMAMGREALLQAAVRADLDAQFICVADLDNVMTSPPTPVVLRSALHYLNDPLIFAVGATSDPFYYDLLSFLAEGHDYRSLQAEIEKAKKHLMTYFQFHRDKIYSNQKRLTITSPLACVSSFNGLCLYRKEEFFQGTYRSYDEANVCEHVNFNLSLARRTGKTMLIVPELRLAMPRDHGPVTFLRFWKDRVYKALNL